MNGYEWISDVIEDLSKFAEQENLKNLSSLLQQASDAVEQDLRTSKNVDVDPDFANATRD